MFPEGFPEGFLGFPGVSEGWVSESWCAKVMVFSRSLCTWTGFPSATAYPYYNIIKAKELCGGAGGANSRPRLVF